MQNLRNISFKNVKFNSGFWKARTDLNSEVSLKSVYDRFEETGRFDALRFNYETGKKPPLHIFFDSDAAKWIESVAYVIESGKRACEDEQKIIDELVLDMAENQLENGYLNSYFIQIKPHAIFSNRDNHELYCAGHLIEAAIAYERATGKSGLMRIMEKYVDHIARVFKEENSAGFATPGHEEIELALLKLYDYKGDQKYLDLAMYFINKRGTTFEPSVCPNWNNNKYDQSERPVRELSEAEGHAVRATYLFIAMSEGAKKTGDKQLYEACRRLFDNIAKKRMYVTGGIGSAKMGESFSVPYDLPNLEAYSESCAAIALALFAFSMQGFELDARYASLVEQVMYNTLLSSTSMDGKAFFYENPMEYHLASVDKETCILPECRAKLPIRHRLEVFGCSCCPPNVTRTIARVGDFFFSEYDRGLVINQYASLSLDTDKVSLEMITDYPACGKVRVKLNRCAYDKIYIRKPDWCEQLTIDVGYELENGYIVVDAGVSEINVDFNMTPYFVECNPMVRANNGRVALMYGPVVYCLERNENDYELNALSVSPTTEIAALKGGCGYFPTLTLNAYLDDSFDSLYRKATASKSQVRLTFKPYWTFANGEECDMLVWIRRA